MDNFIPYQTDELILRHRGVGVGVGAKHDFAEGGAIDTCCDPFQVKALRGSPCLCRLQTLALVEDDILVLVNKDSIHSIISTENVHCRQGTGTI
jgi:hypothetical protein